MSLVEPPTTPASSARARARATDGASSPYPAATVAEAPPTLLDSGWRIARERRWVILQALVVVPLLVVALSLTQAKEYTATAQLLFRQAPNAGLNNDQGGVVPDPQRTFDTNRQLVELPVVAQAASDRMGKGTSAAEIRSAVTVSADGTSDLAAVEAKAGSPGLAAAIANAYAYAYISFRQRTDRAQLQGAIALTQRTLTALPVAQRSGPEAARLTSRLNQLRLAQSLQTGDALVVQRAGAPDSPSSPKVKRNVALGVLLGLLLGFGLAVLLDRLDRRVRSAEELEELYGLPLVARIPRSTRIARALAGRAEAADSNLDTEDFRILRANLRYLDSRRRLRSLLVASPSQGDGKSTVARNLAMTMAEMGDRVVLVEADLHKPESAALGRATEEGLSTVLAGGALNSALVPLPAGTEEEPREVFVLPPGPKPPNPSELIDSERMREILRRLEVRHDLVIVDSPPIAVVADALALVPEVSGILVVTGVGRTMRGAATRLRQELGMLGGHAVGVVANFCARPQREYYGGYRR